jgi:hypothetical protein
MKKNIFLTILLLSISGFNHANAGFEFTAPISTSNQNVESSSGLYNQDSVLLPEIVKEPLPQINMSPIQGNQPLFQNDPVQTITPREQAPQNTFTGIMSVAPKSNVNRTVEPSIPQFTEIQELPSVLPSSPVASQSQFNRENVQSTSYDMVVGFGENLPFITALRQIIPSDYTFILGRGVNASQLVSWSGGAEWPEILGKIAQNIGLTITLQNNRVLIEQSQQTFTNSNLFSIDEPSFDVAETMNRRVKPDQATLMGVSKSDIFEVSLNQSQSKNIQPAQVSMPTSLVTPAIEEPSISDSLPFRDYSADFLSDSQPQWIATRGSSLKTVLQSWSDLENVQLYWDSGYDYNLISDVQIEGEFNIAVEKLLEGFSRAQPQPIGRFHPNLPNGPAVLVIENNRA